MSKYTNYVMDYAVAENLKRESEEALKKIDEGIKWGTYALIAFVLEIVFAGLAVFATSGNDVFEMLAAFPMIAHMILMVISVVKGGGVKRVFKAVLEIALWVYRLIPFYFIDFMFAFYAGAIGIGLFFNVPVIFYLRMKKTYKDDLETANAYLQMYGM